MEYEALLDATGRVLGGEVRPAGAVWSDADLALGELVRFGAKAASSDRCTARPVPIDLSDANLADLRRGAMRLTRSGKISRVAGYVDPELPSDAEDRTRPRRGNR